MQRVCSSPDRTMVHLIKNTLGYHGKVVPDLHRFVISSLEALC